MGAAKAMKMALEVSLRPKEGKALSQDHRAASNGFEFSVTGWVTFS